MTRAERLAALEVEAGRVKERLDTLEAFIQGEQDAWIRITVNLPETVAEVTVDKALSEARQQALAYATICKTIVALTEEEAGEKAGSPESEFMRRQAEREASRQTLAQQQ